MTKHQRAPISIGFPEGIADEDYLSLAAAIRAVADLCPAPNEMTIDPDLDAAYDEVDPHGPARTREASRSS